jgi:NAD(P)H-dependent flavin oxidoreductase YrpB (nitropropane dioxygenase family)
VGDAAGFVEALRMGYAGVQCGTRFIATPECDASASYKQALLDADADDVVLTERITGVPVAVLDTPVIRRMGLKANALERWLLRNPRTKHLIRHVVRPALGVQAARWRLARGLAAVAGGQERGDDRPHRAGRRHRARLDRGGARGVRRRGAPAPVRERPAGGRRGRHTAVL